jgi:GMP synthase (glutamine-hydrolysing)
MTGHDPASAPRRTAVAIRHIEFGDLGSMGRTLSRYGFDIHCIDAGSAEFEALDPLQPDIVAVMGGPFGANDEATHPFIIDELELIARRTAAGRATLGICLGAQLMARALGGRVYEGPELELGWAEVALTGAGRSSCLSALGAAGTNVLHWHGDTFDLPPGATLLASTTRYLNQAYSVGDAALGMQFHPEVEAASMPRWLAHPRIAAWLSGLDAAGQRPAGFLPEQLDAGARRHGSKLVEQSSRLMEAWLAQLDFN